MNSNSLPPPLPVPLPQKKKKNSIQSTKYQEFQCLIAGVCEQDNVIKLWIINSGFLLFEKADDKCKKTGIRVCVYV